ncbi:FtsW/RodA/SpoVE family cell cycle protein, partial [Acinetobacter baumannii]|nr:FtsW/RodA/SpoVE family cell cycle protein [Acinetobacter baumannii]
IKLITLSGGILFPGRLKYVYNRFRIFDNPFVDPLGDGHQMINSYFSMINGGWFGLGIGNSIQKKGFLTAAQTDFMFSIVIEELGLLVSLLILALLLFLILRIFMIGIKSKDTFNAMMCIGISGMILIQTFINIGGITGIIPLTGVTFPFLSSGGSSLLTLSIGIGFALNISADEKKKIYDEHN